MVTITVTCYTRAPSSGDHLLTCGAIFWPPHRDVSIEHCVRTYIIVYSTPYRLFLFVAENRLTYSSRTWNDLQEQKKKTHRKTSSWKDSSSTQEAAVNHIAFPNCCRDSKLLISTCKLFYISAFTDNNMILFDHDLMQRSTQDTDKTKFHRIW